jgi:hypothetical protein
VSDARFELIGIYQGTLDVRQFAPGEAEADRQARELRALYRERGKGWAVYVVPHSCEPGGECSCIEPRQGSTP